MTEVYLDGHKLDVSFTDEAKLGELLGAIERELAKAKRFVVEVLLDGDMIEDRKSEAFLGARVRDAGEVRLLSVPLEGIVLDAVDLCQRHDAQIRGDMDRAVEALRLGREAEGYVLVARVFESLNMLANTLSGLHDAAGKYGISLFKGPLHGYMESLVKLLEEARLAREARDTVLLADILEYELLPLMEDMGKNVFMKGDA